MIKEHELIVLQATFPKEGLKAGDVGTVVHIHSRGEAFEVEFFTLDGNTAAIATVLRSQIRAVSNRDLTHARLVDLSV